MVVNNSGNVGIGTTGPGATLDVLNKNTSNTVTRDLIVRHKGASAIGDGTGILFQVQDPGTNMAAIEVVNDVSNAASMRFLTRTAGTLTEQMRIINTGNVGIGTTTPVSKLQIVGTTTAQTILPEADNLYSLGASGRRWANLYAATTSVGDLLFANEFRIAEADNSAPLQALIFKNQRGEEIMTIDEKGNVTFTGVINGFVEKTKQALNSLGILIENGITKIEKLFVKEIIIDTAQIEKAKIQELTSKKICLEGDDGEKICIDKNQLKELLNKNNINLNNDNNGNNLTSTQNDVNQNSTENQSNTTTIDENINNNENTSKNQSSVSTSGTSTDETNNQSNTTTTDENINNNENTSENQSAVSTSGTSTDETNIENNNQNNITNDAGNN
jgi:hypothetical protein